MQTTIGWCGRHRCWLQGWDDFRREGTALIRLLGDVEGRFIIFAHRNRHRFVQFRVFENGVIRGEAASNNFLGKGRVSEDARGEWLTPATCRDLVELGWKKPAKTSPNYWSNWQPPLPISKMVTLTVTTLRDAFEIASPDELEIEIEDDDETVGDWDRGGPRGRGIKVNNIAHFDARGMRRVFGRGISYLGGHDFNMDVWLTRSGRLLARFWSRSSKVDWKSYEIVGLPLTPPPTSKRREMDERWVPQCLRDEYDNWIVSET